MLTYPKATATTLATCSSYPNSRLSLKIPFHWRTSAYNDALDENKNEHARISQFNFFFESKDAYGTGKRSGEKILDEINNEFHKMNEAMKGWRWRGRTAMNNIGNGVDVHLVAITIIPPIMSKPCCLLRVDNFTVAIFIG